MTIQSRSPSRSTTLRRTFTHGDLPSFAQGEGDGEAALLTVLPRLLADNPEVAEKVIIKPSRMRDILALKSQFTISVPFLNV